MTRYKNCFGSNFEYRIFRSADNMRSLVPQYSKAYRYWNPPGSPIQSLSVVQKVRYLGKSVLRLIRRRNASPPIILASNCTNSNEPEANEDYIVWLGHSTFLISLGGVRLITDPILSKRASPFTGVGPKRTDPRDWSEHIGKIDIVLLSHDHYDHCDKNTLRKIASTSDCILVAPRGLLFLLEDIGFKEIIELDWMDYAAIGNLTVHSVPAVHWSGRLGRPRNKTLWMGFHISVPGRPTIYFSGDTAYSEIFKVIGSRLGVVNYALVPIGGYEPNDVMKAHHVDPEQAVRIARDLGAKTLIAHHWGTYPLTHEPLEEPPKRFVSAATTSGFDPKDVWVLAPGEARRLD